MLIGILNCGHFAQREGAPTRDYDTLYSEMLEGHGFEFRCWHVVDMEFPTGIHDADGWLLGGSKHGVYDKEPFIAPLKEFVRSAYEGNVPVVGVCFGHQLIAQALGGHVEKFSEGWGMGHTDYTFGSETLTLNAFHQDQVVRIPPDAKVVGRTDFCENAALAYSGPAFSVQPHPEFTPEDMALLYDQRAPQIADKAVIDAARARSRDENHNSIMANRIAAFFKEAVA